MSTPAVLPLHAVKGQSSAAAWSNLLRLWEKKYKGTRAVYGVIALLALLLTATWMGVFGGRKSAKQEPIGFASRKVKRSSMAFAVTLTSLHFDEKGRGLLDGLHVLRESIETTCVDSAYFCDAVAFLSPNVPAKVHPIVEAAGWQVYPDRDVPVDITRIKGDNLRERIDKSGCCGASELIKLWSWTLLQYDRVVHMDVDTMLLGPLDELLDLEEEFVYTLDPAMATSKRNTPVQGGFLLLKPSMDVFENLVQIIYEGNWGGQGWRGSGIGFFWGGATIQGILSYYYRSGIEASPGQASEANRCMYNQMFDTDECMDFAADHRDLVRSVHFTQKCPKPWSCSVVKDEACLSFISQWNGYRTKLLQARKLQPLPLCKGGSYVPLPLLPST
jgi:hypothetical protein